MDEDRIRTILKKKPGYEAVYLLLQSEQRRKDIVEYVETNSDISGGTIDRWLDTAVDSGLISPEIRSKDGRRDIVYSLAVKLSPSLREEIIHRGGDGGRDNSDEHADNEGVTRYNDKFSHTDTSG